MRFHPPPESVHNDIPTTEPATLSAGVDWAWNIEDSEHLSEGWTLKYALRGPASLNITATAGETAYEIRVPYTDNEGLEAGTYRFIAVLEKDGERIPAREGQIQVEPNLFGLDDLTTHAQRVLSLIETLLEGRVPKGLSSFSINGRQVQYMSVDELLKLKAHYQELVNQERRESWSQPVGVRFGPIC